MMKKISAVLTCLLILAGMSAYQNRARAQGGMAQATVSATMGGSVLLAGACASTTTTLNGVTIGMGVLVTPTTYPGDGVTWTGYVSAPNTVVLKVCAIVGLTPTSSTYTIRVIP